MSPTRPSSSRPGRHRDAALRLPLVAGLSLALAIPALAACQDESGPSPSSRPSASSSASPSSRSSGKSSKPSDKPSDAGGNSNVDWLLHGSSPSPSPDGR